MKIATQFTMSGRRLVLGALLALTTTTTALAQQPIDKLDARLRLAIGRAASSAADAPQTAAVTTMHDVFLTGDPDVIRTLVARHGGRVRTVAGEIVTARLPQSALLPIASSASVRRLQGSSAIRRFNETAARSVDALRVWTAPPSGQQAYTGKGVIVGIIDSGIDWTHPDFRDPDDSTKTRILRIWDQADSLGDGAGTYDYGTEWTKQQIDAAVRDRDTAAIRHRDAIGHGTHVTGTAAGSGRAIGHHRGMAYEADIAVVGLDWGNSTALVDAAAYLFELGRQLGRPVVINMSLGSVDAPRDGSDAVDIALDNLVKETSGRVVCVAAGNLGEEKAHWGPSLSSEPAWSYVMYDPNGWSDPTSGLPIIMRAVVRADAIDSTMIAVGLDSLRLDQEGRPTPVAADSTEWLSIAEIVASPVPAPMLLTYRDGSPAGQCMLAATPEGENYYAIYVIFTDIVEDDFNFSDPLGDGVDFFRVKFKGSSRVHMWSAMGMAVDTEQFDGPVDAGYGAWDNAYSVTSPGTAQTALTVGAYSNVAQFENYVGETVPLPRAGVPGELAVFSSVGPSFDERLKPEIVAPGHGVISSLAFNLRDVFLGIDDSPVAKGGYHAIFSGTSMACPVVTGSVALYFQKNPTASYEQVKSAIIGAARADAQTSSHGPLPNAHWGHGKLDIYNAIYGTTSGVENGDETAGLALGPSVPNPASTATTISFFVASRQEVRLDIVDMMGAPRATLLEGELDAGRHEARLDATTLEPGVYTYRLTAGGTTRSARLTVVR